MSNNNNQDNQNQSQRPQLKNFGEMADATTGKKYPVYRPTPDISADLKAGSEAGYAPLINVTGALYGVKSFSGVPTSQDLVPIEGGDSFHAWAEEAYDLIWTGDKLAHAAYAGQKVRPVAFGPVIKSLVQHLPYAEGVEFMPHYPERPRTHYLRGEAEYQAGDGSKLDELISKLNPETDADRALLKAMFLTPCWGGPGGQRPLYMLTSEHGRGVGKSTTAEILGHLYGGLTMLDAGREGAKTLARKLGSPDEVSKRVVLIDNVKTKQSSATYEKMITTRHLAADRLYHGAFQPPNVKTWVMTLNTGDASTDIASRVVVIKIGPPPWGKASPTFKSDIYAFIDEHRETLLGDILGVLKSPAAYQLAVREGSRWKEWEHAVLARVGGDDLLDLIETRRGEVDTEADEARDIIMLLRRVLAGAGIDPDTTSVCIPTEELIPPLKEFWDESRIPLQGKKGVWARLKPFYVSAAFKGVGATKGRDTGRTYNGLVWRADPDPDAGVLSWDEALDQAAAKGPNIIGFPAPITTAFIGEDDEKDVIDSVDAIGEPDGVEFDYLLATKALLSAEGATPEQEALLEAHRNAGE